MKKIATLYSLANLQKNIFLYKKYVRDYIQLYPQPYLSEVYSEHLLFLLQHFLYQK